MGEHVGSVTGVSVLMTERAGTMREMPGAIVVNRNPEPDGSAIVSVWAVTVSDRSEPGSGRRRPAIVATGTSIGAHGPASGTSGTYTGTSGTYTGASVTYSGWTGS